MSEWRHTMKKKKNSNCKLSAWLFLYVTESFFSFWVFFLSYRTNGVGLVWFKTCTRFYISFPHECLFAFFLRNNICWIFLRFFSLAVVCASIRLAFSSIRVCFTLARQHNPRLRKIKSNEWMKYARKKTPKHTSNI